MCAARIGLTVWELDGLIPMLNMSNTLGRLLTGSSRQEGTTHDVASDDQRVLGYTGYHARLTGAQHWHAARVVHDAGQSQR